MKIMMGIIVALLAGQASARYDHGYDYSNYGYRSSDRTFECKSSGYSPTYCRVDTRYGITLVQQISTSDCVQGQSWGFDDRGVWVSDGCKARFALGGRDDNYASGYGNSYGNGYANDNSGARVIRCESNGSRVTYCRADTSGGVQMARQISSTACQQGRNWGYDRSGIWVNGGCRADFSVGGYGSGYQPGYGNGYQPGYARIVRCDSNGSRTVRCNADTSGGVRLLRRVSKSSCIEGRSWGYDRYGIWVSGGCRAEFQTGGGRSDEDYQRY